LEDDGLLERFQTLPKEARKAFLEKAKQKMA